MRTNSESILAVTLLDERLQPVKHVATALIGKGVNDRMENVHQTQLCANDGQRLNSAHRHTLHFMAGGFPRSTPGAMGRCRWTAGPVACRIDPDR